MKLLEGKYALVTGASRGIGRAIALAFAAEGAHVAVNYNSSTAAALEVKEEIEKAGGKCLLLQCDVSDYSAVVEMSEEVSRSFGHLDILVNCAGIMNQCPAQSLDPEIWMKVINTNLSSAFFTTQVFLPMLKKSAAGRIINMSSQAAFTGSRNRTAYSSAKAGLLGLTYSLAKELGPDKITVNAISPGRIITDMITRELNGREEEWLAATPLGRFGTPEEIADTAVFLASEKGAYLTGANLNVNGGILMG
jgi:3-oxoacyl-[acyl-carrier protein] reductase